MGFMKAEAQTMPTRACIGYIDDISAAKETESGVYANCRITIKALEAGRGTMTNLLFRPEWFTPGFNPKTIEEVTVEGASQEEVEKLRKGMVFMYRRLFGTKDTPGQLEVMVGGAENLDALSEKFENIGGEPSIETVGEIIKSFVIDTAATVGYILKQAREKTDEVDEAGKQVYVLRENYELSEWFLPTEANKKRMRNRAAKANGDFLVTFEV